jgi:hypothetical protein
MKRCYQFGLHIGKAVGYIQNYDSLIQKTTLELLSQLAGLP